MSDAEKTYGLLTETSDIEETRNPDYQRHLPVMAAYGWLQAGWRDMTVLPSLSFAYGLGVFLVSLVVVAGMFALSWDDVLFPAIAGFLIFGPTLAIGLYEKSRALEREETVTAQRVVRVRAESGAQIFFVGVLLCLLMLLWMRAAVIVYALFFGYRPFPGLENVAAMLFATGTGWVMLIVGTAIGGLFAAFSFSISAFSIPMLLNERTDALTAMGTSMALVWNNLPVMIAWGAIAMGLFMISLLTGLLGLIVVFPLLGHATWHAYKAIRQPDRLAKANETANDLESGVEPA